MFTMAVISSEFFECLKYEEMSKFSTSTQVNTCSGIWSSRNITFYSFSLNPMLLFLSFNKICSWMRKSGSSLSYTKNKGRNQMQIC